MANAIFMRPLPAIGAVTAYGTTTDGDPRYLFNDFAGVCWSSPLASNGPQYETGVNFDLGSDQLIDTLFVFGIDLLPDATIALFGWPASAPGRPVPPPYSVSASYIAPDEGRGVGIVLFDTPVPARYFQLSFYTDAPASLRASRVAIGRRIQLKRNFTFGADFGVKDLGAIEWSRLGVMNRRRGAKLRTVSLAFSSIHKDEVQQAVKPLLEHVGVTEPIALLTDPADHPIRQTCAYFGPLTGDTLSVVWRRADAFSSTFNLVSLF